MAGGKEIRNTARTTIAPTGSISLIAGCSSGIEPNFSLVYEQKVEDERVVIVKPVFEQVARERSFYGEGLMEKILEHGNLEKIDDIPEEIKRVFVTALEIEPEWHVRIQAAFQEYTDNSVSKTVNLPADTTVEDVNKIFRLAHELGCKGITVYRNRSRENQVIAAALAPTKILAPRPRPRKTKGETIKFRTGCGTIFVTVNKDDRGLCEVFANLGKGGGCAAQTEATCRAVSIGLRSGIEPGELIEQLRNIRCLSTVARRKANKDITILSCADAIAVAIEEAAKENCPLGMAMPVNKCPDCGHPLRREEGCNVCDKCSYVKCG